MTEFDTSHYPSISIGACVLAEPAFYAYLLCEPQIQVVTLAVHSNQIDSVLKSGFGYDTLLQLTGSRAGWIWEPYDEKLGQGGVFYRRPLFAYPHPRQTSDVSEGFLRSREGRRMDKSKIQTENVRTIFNSYENFLEKLIGLIVLRKLALDEDRFRANVDAYTQWFLGTHRDWK